MLEPGSALQLLKNYTCGLTADAAQVWHHLGTATKSKEDTTAVVHPIRNILNCGSNSKRGGGSCLSTYLGRLLLEAAVKCFDSALCTYQCH